MAHVQALQTDNAKGKERAVPVSAPVHTQPHGSGSASVMTDLSEVGGGYDGEGMADEEDEPENEEVGEDEEDEDLGDEDEPEAEDEDEGAQDLDEEDGAVGQSHGGSGVLRVGHDSMDVDEEDD